MKGMALAAGSVSAFAAGAALTSPETRDSLAWAWTFALTIVREGPLGLWAVLIGVTLGWMSMAWARALMPSAGGVDPRQLQALQRRRMLIWTIGLLVTFAAVYLIWRSAWGIWLGVTLGLAAPWTWEGVLLLVGVVSPTFAQKLRGSPL